MILKIRLPAEVKKNFDKLAKMKRCTKSYLAGEAILDYAARQRLSKKSYLLGRGALLKPRKAS
jgi:predicted transcriptional regulator